MASFNNPVDARIWGDKKFKAMSKAEPNAQTLFLYLLTGPHNRGMPGLYALPCSTIGEALGWQSGDVAGAMRELSRPARPMARADWPAGVVFLPQAFVYRPPQAESNVKGWVRLFEAIPESDLRADWIVALADHIGGRGRKFWGAFVDDFGAAAASVDVVLGSYPGDEAAGPTDNIINGIGAFPMKGGTRAPAPGGPGPDRGVDRGVDQGAELLSPILNPSPSPIPSPGGGELALPDEGREMATELVEQLRRLMRENDPRVKTPIPGSVTYRKWVDEIERIHRLDGRPWAQIRDVIVWSQGDGFWKSNILSAGKLRSKFTTLLLRMGKTGGRRANNALELRRALGED